MPISRIIAFDSSLNGLQALFFFANRLEVLVEEDDSRSSSRDRENGSFLLVSQLHVVIQTLWSQCIFPRAVWTNRWIVLPVHVWSASTSSSASLSWSGRLTDTGTQLENKSSCSYIGAFAFRQDTFVDFLSTRTRWLLCQDRSPCFLQLDFCFFWLGLLGVFTTSSIFRTQFFHPIVLRGNLWRRWRWHIYFLVNDFSSSHHDSLRDTIG